MKILKRYKIKDLAKEEFVQLMDLRKELLERSSGFLANCSSSERIVVNGFRCILEGLIVEKSRTLEEIRLAHRQSYGNKEIEKKMTLKFIKNETSIRSLSFNSVFWYSSSGSDDIVEAYQNRILELKK